MGLGERGDYVNQMKKCSVCRSRVSPCGFPLVAPASPPLFSLALPLCRMSDPVSTAPLPAWERHEALRHKQNTDKNTRRAMCRPVSQNTPSALSLSLLSPFTLLLSLSFTHTHTNSESRQRANSLLGITDTPVAVGIITLALSSACRAADRLVERFLKVLLYQEPSLHS